MTNSWSQCFPVGGEL